MQKTFRGVFIVALAGMAAYGVRAAVPTLTDVDVGLNNGAAGSMTVTTDASGNVYDIKGSGDDIWNAADSFNYAYFNVSGDFDYIVKVRSLTGNANDGGWTKAEFMAREADSSGVPQGGDRFVANMATTTGGQNNVAIQWRIQARDGNAAWPSDVGLSAPATPPNYPNCWLRLRRKGSVFINYYSTNGTTFTELNRVDTGAANGTAAAPPDGPFANNLLLGLAVTAHSAAANGDLSEAVFSDFGAHTAIPVAIVTQPAAAVTLNVGDPLELTVVATGDPIDYQWRKGSTDIAGATAATYKVASARASDAGTYSVVVSNPGNTVTSANAVVTLNPDTVAPTLVSARASGFTAVYVTFSEPLDPTTAQQASNYQISGGVTVSAAALSAYPNDNVVVLTTSQQAEGTTFTLTVNNVKDLAGNTIVANTQTQFPSFVFTSGAVIHHKYDNVTDTIGASPDNLFSDPRFPNAPDRVDLMPMWEYPAAGAASQRTVDPERNYFDTLEAYFIPPTTGNYVFFIAGADRFWLYLSTDDSPANKHLIAAEPGGWSDPRGWVQMYSGTLENRRSDQMANAEWPNGNTITLTAGKRYYMLEVHHDPSWCGADDFGATYIMEGDADPANASAPTLTGSVVGWYLDPSGASVTFTKQPQSVTVQQGRNGTFTVGATGTSAYGTTVSYQWQKAAKGSSTFTDIAGATASAYKTPALTLADDGSQYRVVAKVPSLSVNSDIATLNVVPDTFPPVPTVGAIVNTNGTTIDVGIGFDEPVDPAAASLQANYTLTGGTISGFTWYTNSQSVILKVTGLAAGGTGTVTVKNVKDLLGNAISATGTNVQFTVSTKMKWGVVGGQGKYEEEVTNWAMPVTGNWVVPVADNGFDVYSDGRTEWNNYDESTFVYEEITGDFDKKVRVEYQDQSSQWARAGIVVRDVTNFGVDLHQQIGSQAANVNTGVAPFDGLAGRYQKCHVNPVGPTMTGPGTAGNGLWEGNRRLETGGPCTTALTANNSTPQYPNAWCRIQRQGQLFTIYRSDDGVTWLAMGTTTFTQPMPDKVFVGPEFSPENGNITNEEDRGVWLAKFREYGDTFGAQPGNPTLSASVAADGKVTLTYTGTLVSSDTVNGTYSDVQGATSPFTFDPKTGAKAATFYQSKQ